MTRLALTLATWFGCGYFPWGPGTAGSLAALAIAALLHFYLVSTRVTLVFLAILLFLPGVWAATQTARYVQTEDPGLVVIDEVLGQWITLAGVAVLNTKSLIAGFLLFRLLDIWKPWPIRKLERLPEGWGIMADDVAAGILGALMLYIGGSRGLY